MISILNPFYLDPWLAEFDAVLHGGYQAWELTHAIVVGADATFIVAVIYAVGWFVVMWGFLFWQTCRLHRPVERQQFFTAFVLCWVVLGAVAALFLSSAGPCYYADVTGMGDLYAPLMDRLTAIQNELVLHEDFRRTGLRALDTQGVLWESYTTGEVIVGAGISAMPSMHVAIATLCALTAWQANRIFGCIMIVYVLVIVFGSVHLAWHYAVDAYFAIIGTFIIWHFSGGFARYFCKDFGDSTSNLRLQPTG
ncbi:MAG: phosphatase PAP2 family protein [Pseudomonadales bacterium]